MQRSDLLVRTKLRLPFIRSGLVSRPHLQDKIARGLQGPLTVVIAPAGFGKTTLVATSLDGCHISAGWLSLDKDDNQTGRFLTYLIAALQEVDHSIGSDAAHLIGELQQTSSEAVLTILLNDLDNSTAEITLVLDDYQFISNQEIHKAVNFLLEHCPNTFHLVIATRSDPPIPLSRLRARGLVVEIRGAELRFTLSEATQFLNEVIGLGLNVDSVASLEERTDGWIARWPSDGGAVLEKQSGY